MLFLDLNCSDLWFLSQIPLCLIAIFILWKLFAKDGLFVYISLAAIAANIQVLKVVDLSFFSEPVALGTIIFSTSFLAMDMLVEFYNFHEAFKALFLSFFAMMIFFTVMQITIHITGSENASNPYNMSSSTAIQVIFSPSFRLLLSGVIAFFISQFLDIFCYNIFRNKYGLNPGKSSFLSSMFSSVIDTLIFTFLAFKVLAFSPLQWHELFYYYIFNTSIIRLIMSGITGFCMALFRYLTPNIKKN